VTTWLRQDRIGHDHEVFVGSMGYGAHEVTERAVREADVLLALGCRFSEFSTKRWTLVSDEARLVHVDVDPDELGRVYLPDVGIVADAASTATALLDVVPDIVTGDDAAGRRQERLRELRATYVAESSLDSPALAEDQPGDGVSSIAVIKALQQLVDDDAGLIVQDTPSFGPWSHRYLKLPRPGRFLGSAGGAMAWGFPAAMGVALTRPEERVVSVNGDGCFWMVAQDFETCVRERIPVVVVVMNNDAYGNTRDRQRSAHDSRYLGVFYGNPDFAEFARSLGGYGVRVTRDEDVASALAEALKQELPAIVEVAQDQMYGLPPGLVPPAAR
jgi:acetolactate synthase-1/2/3 large subunit